MSLSAILNCMCVSNEGKGKANKSTTWLYKTSVWVVRALKIFNPIQPKQPDCRLSTEMPSYYRELVLKQQCINQLLESPVRGLVGPEVGRFSWRGSRSLSNSLRTSATVSFKWLYLQNNYYDSGIYIIVGQRLGSNELFMSHFSGIKTPVGQRNCKVSF